MVACGGGGGGSAPAAPSLTVSGVAAAGAPIVGFAYLKDKNNKEAGPAAIDQSGNFSFTLDASYVAPFVLKAEGAAGGQGYKLYSASTGFGTANINPLTNLAVATATGQNPDALYEDVSASSASITSAALTAAVSDIKAMLQPLLDAKNITQFNPLSGAYAADGTGLDGVLDVVKVQVNADNSVNLINKAMNTTISSGTIDSLPASIDSATATQLLTTMTDLDAIAQGLAAFATALNKGANLTAADLQPFYAGTAASSDVYGYNNGYDRQQQIDDFVMMFSQSDIISQLGGLKEVKNLTLVKKINPQELINAITHSATTLTEIYQIRADFYFGDGSFGAPEGPMLIAKEGGKWKLIGNQRLIDVSANAAANKWLKADGTTLVKTGMEVYPKDVGLRGVNSMRIEGPGLPEGGVTFSKTQQSVNLLILDLQDSTLPTHNWSFVPLDDATIGGLSEAAEAYTVTLYTDLTAPAPGSAYLQRFKETIVKKPVLNADLKAADFGTVAMQGLDHSMTFANANMMGKTVTIGLTKPIGYVVKWTEVGIEFWGNTPGIEVDKTVSQIAGSVSLIVPSASGFTPFSGQMSIRTEDQFGRAFTYHYMFQ